MALIALAIVVSTAIGVAAERRWGETAQEASRRSLLGVLYLLLPLITFFNLSRAEFDSNIGVGVLLAYVALGTAVGLAYIVCTRMLDLPRRSVGSVLCCVVVSNTGYLGYPATVALLGSDQLSQAVVYDVVVCWAGPDHRRLLDRSRLRRQGRRRRPRADQGLLHPQSGSLRGGPGLGRARRAGARHARRAVPRHGDRAVADRVHRARRLAGERSRGRLTARSRRRWTGRSRPRWRCGS